MDLTAFGYLIALFYFAAFCGVALVMHIIRNY